MKKTLFLFAVTLAMMSLAVFGAVSSTTEAQVVVCPVGYVCTPIACPVGFVCTPTESQPVNCPQGYTCKIIESTPTNPPCFVFSVNLLVGSSGPDVTNLQKLLISQGYGITSIQTGVEISGYFGPETKAAVMAFQANNGIPSTGFVGPLTRAALNSIGCTNVSSYIQANLISTDTVVSGFEDHDVGTFIIKFRLTALEEDVLIPKIASYNGKGIVGEQFDYRVRLNGVDNSDSQINSVIRVSSETYDLPEYYALQEGESRDVTLTVTVIPSKSGLTSVFLESIPVKTVDGSNTGSVAVSFGTENVLLKGKPTSNTLSPVIHGGTFPSKLAVGETGTWKIEASDPQNGSLSYSVDWGDAVCPPGYVCTTPVNTKGFVQTSTYTHSYNTAGVYTVKFTVRNSAGLTAETSTTVNVGGGTLAQSITVISPNGGEVWNPSKQYEIRWRYSGLTGQEMVDISLISSNGSVCSLGRSPIYHGVFYSIPNSQGCSAGQYKAQVVLSDTEGKGIADQSDNYFAISSNTPGYTSQTISAVYPVELAKDTVLAYSVPARTSRRFSFTSHTSSETTYFDRFQVLQEKGGIDVTLEPEAAVLRGDTANCLIIPAGSSRKFNFAVNNINSSSDRTVDKIQPISGNCAPAKTGITVTSPKDGEDWQVGMQYKIIWTDSRLSGNQKGVTPHYLIGMAGSNGKEAIAEVYATNVCQGSTCYLGWEPQYVSTNNQITIYDTANDPKGTIVGRSSYFDINKSTTSEKPYITYVAGKAALNGEIHAGSTVGIQGTNLSGNTNKDATKVYIGGKECTITQLSSTLIYCNVPPMLNVGSTYDLYINTVGSGGDKVTSNIVKVKVLSSVVNNNSTREAIRQLYLTLLKREPDAQGWDYWVAMTQNNSMDSIRTQIMATIEYTTKQKINNLYIELLGRQADDQGLNYWFNLAQRNNYSIDVVRKGIMNSGEYEARNKKTNPIITVGSPNGGEVYYQADKISFIGTVNYSSANLVAYLYSPERGNVATVNVSKLGPSGKFNGSISGDPGIATGSYKITVCDDNVSNPQSPGKPLCDHSDNYFTIKSNLVEIAQPIVPTVSLNVTKSAGSDANLDYTVSWSSTDAKSCSLGASEEEKGGDWSGHIGSVETSGNITAPVTSNTTFTITCKGDGGSATKSQSVSVVAQSASIWEAFSNYWSF